MRNSIFSRFIAAFVCAAIFIPSVTFAFPFGGMIGQIIFCFNNAIYAAVGPPNGGPFIWTPSTRTYQFGPPSHVGQWLLGLAAPPYYCLVSIQPVIVWSGVLMTMEGSSGGRAPGLPGGAPSSIGGGFGTAVGDLGTAGNNTQTVNHLLVSEVYYQADTAHGGKIENQWIEIFNPTLVPVDLTRWSIQTASTTQLIPAGTIIGAKSYVVLTASAATRQLWNITASVPVVTFVTPFSGFLPNGDHVYLQDPTGVRIDAVSYARDVTAFNPSVPSVLLGRSILRKTLATDSDTAADWIDTSPPNPGR